MAQPISAEEAPSAVQGSGVAGLDPLWSCCPCKDGEGVAMAGFRNLATDHPQAPLPPFVPGQLVPWTSEGKSCPGRSL